MSQARIAVPRDRIIEFCRRNHVRSLSLFGSVLRADFRPDSDVDVLVEFQPQAKIGFLAMSRMQRELGAGSLGFPVKISSEATARRG